MESQPATTFNQLIDAVRKVTAEVAAREAPDVDAKARFPLETLAALREYHVLSAAVPRELGGPGCNMQELAQMCATLAQACGSSAMVLAMHYIQLACIARHGMDSEFFRGYLQLVAEGLAQRFEQGMPYWIAAMDLPLGPYQRLALRERLVATAAATYHHLGAPKVPPAEVLERMAQAHFDGA